MAQQNNQQKLNVIQGYIPQYSSLYGTNQNNQFQINPQNQFNYPFIDMKTVGQMHQQQQQPQKKQDLQDDNDEIQKEDFSQNEIENKQTQQHQQQNTNQKYQMKFENILKDSKRNEICNITLHIKKYSFDLNDKVTVQTISNNSIFLTIIYNLDVIQQQFNKKQFQKSKKVLNITDHYQITALEYYLDHISNLIEFRRKNPDKVNEVPHESESDKCCVCQNELYDNVYEMDFNVITNQLNFENEMDVIGMDKCNGHGFHQVCLENYIQSRDDQKSLRCPVCSVIYGIYMGDQPEGKMHYHLDKNLHCDGYNNVGTWIIQYQFPHGTTKKGVSYHGTNRLAYLPDSEEGREILELFKISFDRKLTFTIGTSVTTGQTNTTVWNGIHHKTHTHGGFSSFGYPDKSYFSRVKEELAAKGVYSSQILNQKQK